MSQETVYVIGAGASFEVGLPVGEELKNAISKVLYLEFDYGSFSKGDYDVYDALRRHNKENVNDYLRECRHISDNMPLAISIDNFIDSERGNERLALCAKIGIVKSILHAEKSSLLYVDPSAGREQINFSSLESTWYLPFFRSLTENLRADELEGRFNQITLVIFNYDRCIEHFLLNALKSYYRLSEKDAASLISCLTIIHPYGKVGYLPWAKQDNLEKMVFGGQANSHNLISFAGQISTFTEGAHSAEIEALRGKMAHTKRLVFLGFAFHRLNMELMLADSTDKYKNANLIDCYATAFNTSLSDQKSISGSIQYLFEQKININIENTTCLNLFRDYSRSLGFR